jgi:hypothetical protein
MADPIVERIARDAGVPDLVEILSERLTPTDLQSLLLEVFRRNAGARSPKDVLDQYERGRFARPATIDPRVLAEFDRLAFDLLPAGFEPVELAPVEPLGAVSVLSGLSQDVVVTTIRNTEAVSDPTNLLALECAARRRASIRTGDRRARPVKLCASQRAVRGQRYEDAELSSHFRLLGLVTAGRAEASYRMELESLTEQLGFHVHLLIEAEAIGIRIEGIEISITDLTVGGWTSNLASGVVEPLSGRFPEIRIRFDPERESGRGYYERACFKLHAHDTAGNRVEVLDGGFTDWTQSLLGDRKERLLISGLGTERVCTRFRTGRPG